jgi:hypothetical protein
MNNEIYFPNADKKTFIVKKLDIKNNVNLKKRVESAFLDPEKYLDLDEEELIVGI